MLYKIAALLLIASISMSHALDCYTCKGADCVERQTKQSSNVKKCSEEKYDLMGFPEHLDIKWNFEEPKLTRSIQPILQPNYEFNCVHFANKTMGLRSCFRGTKEDFNDITEKVFKELEINVYSDMCSKSECNNKKHIDENENENGNEDGGDKPSGATAVTLGFVMFFLPLINIYKLL